MTNKNNFLIYIFIFFCSFILLYMISMFALNPAIDTGRELYIPFRMLNGEVLYRDIFNIYGPLAYQINAAAYSLMGAKILTLRVFGILNLMILMCSVWYICKEFFNININSKVSNGLLFFALFVFSASIFNYILPYSFAITYGLCFCVLSLLFFIKFAKTDLSKFAYLSCLFAGGAVCCKYEFTAYLIFLMIYILFCKKPKTILFSVLSLAILPIISYGTLFLQGMTFDDLTKTFQIMKTMARTNAINYLYSNFSGTYFNLKVFGFCLLKTIVLGVIGIILYYSQKLFKSDRFLSVLVFLFSVVGIIWVGTVGFSLFAMINALLFLIFFKKIFENKPVFVLMLFSILLSLKTFFAVNIESYGIYTLPFIILSIFVFLCNIGYSKNEEFKQNLKNTVVFLCNFIVAIFIITSCVQNLSKFNGVIYTEPIKNSDWYEILTKNIYTNSYIAEPLRGSIDFIEKNTKITDKVVVLPETQFLNFVTKRPADNLYESLTPMYFEAFGEGNVIKHFGEIKPEYFILNNRNTADYGKKYICEDYGQNFCSFVLKNYKKVETFGENQYILQVFKRKDLL